MRILQRLALLLLLASVPAFAAPKPKVRFKTSVGTFIVELEPEAAPKTVENFLGYVRSGFYKGTIFHRVIADFMIQGGGMGFDMVEKKAGTPIVNEAQLSLAKGLKNKKGTLAMARTIVPDSAKAQFFVNVKDNPQLDPAGQFNAGYCVFGRVIKGMDVIEHIRRAKTASKSGMDDVPKKAIIILEAAEVKG